jgi:hypothetical protein
MKRRIAPDKHGKHMRIALSNRSEETRFEEQMDAKAYVLDLIFRGQLLLERPLKEQIHAAMVRLGFVNVRVDHETIHDLWIVRAGIGTNTDCLSERVARKYLRQMAKRVGKRCFPGLLHPIVDRGRIRCAVMFTDRCPQVLDYVPEE